MQESELAFQECLKAIAPVVPFVGAASAPNEPLAWELESFPQLTLTRLERLAGLEYHAILDGLSHPDIAYAEELTFRGLIELAAQLWWIFRGDLLKEGEIRPETDNPRRRTLCYEFGAQRQLSQAIEAAPNSALVEGQKAGSATRLGLIKALHEKGGCAAGCDGRGYKQAEQAVAQLAADLKMDHLGFTWRLSSLAVHQALTERFMHEADGGIVVETTASLSERITFLDRATVIYGVCATAILELINPGALPELAPHINALKDCVANVRQQLEESPKKDHS